MGQAIGNLLPLAVGVALSPIPIVAVVLMLATPRARSNGPAFVLGWVVGLAVAGTLVLLIAGGADASQGGQPATWVDWLKIVLGALLLVVAARQWRGRPRAGEEAELPKWMQKIDGFTAPRAAAVGAALAGINPKNLLLTVAAAAAIAQAGLSAGQEAGALAVFVVVGTVGTAVPVIIYLAGGDRAQTLLAELKEWMGRNNATIMAVLILIIAAKLIGDGISGLTA